MKRNWYAALWILLLAGCATGSALFSAGPRPSEIAGVWVDSSKATPSDTVAWVLAPSGEDRTLEIQVVRDDAMRVTTKRIEKRYGLWFLRGSLADTASRAICFKERPRDGASCVAFQLDTLRSGTGGAPRRRLLVLGFKGHQHTRNRVLYERLP